MRPILVLLALALLLGSTSCVKDEAPLAASGVSITFRTDSGYTSVSDSVPQGDTLLIGATIAEGSNALVRLYLSTSYDGNADIAEDTVPIGSNPFNYEVEHVTRSQPGTEQVIFTVEETDGDRTTRRLTFTVQ